MHGQRTVEILYNMALSFYKSHKYEQAFRLFEKVSHSLRTQPNLWYYMGLSVLHFNLEKMQSLANEQNASSRTASASYSANGSATESY